MRNVHQNKLTLHASYTHLLWSFTTMTRRIRNLSYSNDWIKTKTLSYHSSQIVLRVLNWSHCLRVLRSHSFDASHELVDSSFIIITFNLWCFTLQYLEYTVKIKQELFKLGNIAIYSVLVMLFRFNHETIKKKLLQKIFN